MSETPAYLLWSKSSSKTERIALRSSYFRGLTPIFYATPIIIFNISN